MRARPNTRHMRNILDLLRDDGIDLKPKPGTGGKEFSGPCFKCGGRDRFIVRIESGKFYCRGCGLSGDAIDYLGEMRGLTFKEAITVAGKSVRGSRTPTRTSTPPTSASSSASSVSEFRKAHTPGAEWQEAARSLIESAHKSLLAVSEDPFDWDSDGFVIEGETVNVRGWLHTRGLTSETVERARLGWVGTRMLIDRRAWGLQPDHGRDKVLIPAGLVIPLFDEHGNVVRIRIRSKYHTDGERYSVVAGSSMAPMIIGSDRHPVVIVTESELDRILLGQEAADLVTIVALGSVTTRPDRAADEILKRADLVLIALDADEPGRRETPWWIDRYPNARPWFPVDGKDPGEAIENGVDLREWIERGIEEGIRNLQPRSEAMEFSTLGSGAT